MSHAVFSLKVVGLAVGLLLIASHAWAWAQPELARRWLGRLPRSHEAGIAVLTVDLIWTWLAAFNMDWGEFYYVQRPVLIALPVIFYLVIRYVDEFLSSRALGIFFLLAAAPLLNAAFLQPPESRLLLVILAYGWIVVGMLWVSQPHLLRDQIGWVGRSAARWRVATGAGVVYGFVLLVCAVAFY